MYVYVVLNSTHLLNTYACSAVRGACRNACGVQGYIYVQN